MFSLLRHTSSNCVSTRIQRASAAFQVLADPVIFEVRGIEIGTQSASGSGWDSLCTQHGDEEEDELPAAADKPLVERARDREVPLIESEETVQHLLHWANMNLILALFGDGEAVKFSRHNVVQKKLLNNSDQLSNFVRQPIEGARMLPG